MRKITAWVTVACVGWCMIGLGSAKADNKLRSAKRSSVSMRWASMTPVAGYEAMMLDGEKTVYVAKVATLSGQEIREARTIDSRTGKDLVLNLTGPATTRFDEQWKKHRGESLAVVSGGSLLAVGAVSFNAASSAILMSGLSSPHATRVTQLWGKANPVAGGPTITVVSSQRKIAPGDTVAVDVFISGVPDLRVYQVTLAVDGGTNGSLERRQAVVDTSRSDYVFRNQQKLDAADQTLGRLGGILFGKGVKAIQKNYVGSYVFAASPDASGEFTLKARVDSSSILMDSNNRQFGFVSNPATITVGSVDRIQPRDK